MNIETVKNQLKTEIETLKPEIEAKQAHLAQMQQAYDAFSGTKGSGKTLGQQITGTASKVRWLEKKKKSPDIIKKYKKKLEDLRAQNKAAKEAKQAASEE